MEEGIGVAPPTVSVVVTMSLTLMPFALVAFAPLGACLATVYDLATHRCLALKERIRVCEVDSEWSTANFVSIEVADGGGRCLMIYRQGRLVTARAYIAYLG